MNEVQRNEVQRKGELIRRYILSLVYDDAVPDIVNRAIDDLVQAAQCVQADTRCEGAVESDEVIPF